MEKVSPPTGLLSLTVGAYFNQSNEKVSLPTGLLSFTVGAYLDQATTTTNTTAYTTGGMTAGANTTEAATGVLRNKRPLTLTRSMCL